MQARIKKTALPKEAMSEGIIQSFAFASGALLKPKTLPNTTIE